MINPVSPVTVSLEAGKLTVRLVPAIGGSIARFDHLSDRGQQPLLRPAAPGATSILAMASFPLVPFANRIRGGRFACDGKSIALAANLTGDASPLHGQGWLGQWHVVSAQQQRAELAFSHLAGEWPWDYEAWQDFALDDNGLTVTLRCRNLSPSPMPCGLGQHLYFPCDAHTMLDARVSSAWTVDADTLPVDRVEAQGEYDLHNRRIADTNLDNAFEGWAGTADIVWPGAPVRLRMSSPDAGNFHVYSPVQQDYFAAEPVQNAICALNAPPAQWEELGLAMLSQGATHELTMRLEIESAD